jgi:para-nitrobenzyl esterase
VFHNLRLYDQQWADWDRKLEDIMSSYWTNFAASGDPNGGSVPRWSAYSGAEGDKVMSFGDTAAMDHTRLDKATTDLLDAAHAKLMSR